MDEQTLKNIIKEVVDDSLEPIKTDVSALKQSVAVIEQTMTSYADRYKQSFPFTT